MEYLENRTEDRGERRTAFKRELPGLTVLRSLKKAIGMALMAFVLGRENLMEIDEVRNEK